MADFRRVYDGQCYFFTVVSYRRRPILCDPPVRQPLRQAVLDVRQDFDFKIDAWVLLPDHMHAIWTLPEGDCDYSRWWALIKRKVSQDCGFLYPWHHAAEVQNRRNESFIWQRRFWEHCIRDESDYQKHMDYIHFNPVKHGLTASVSDWQYSTFHRHVRNGIYPADWGGVADADNQDMDFGEP